MVPVSLHLTNFMSYGTEAPSLDFAQFHVACLSGRNGQGKSALLDAITWALWGQARKSAGGHKPDDELIRIGTRQMKVEFVFDLEGERYRVSRSYTRSATGKTTYPELELHLFEPSAGDYRPLTGANIRETQEHIDLVLGIDYDTFINSAFLLQGRSDEFTKKRPNERKQILARILNLSKYDRLADLARERERAAADLLQRAEHEIERLKTSLEPEASWKEAREAAEAALVDLGARLEARRADLRALTERRAQVESVAREAEAAEQRVRDAEGRQASLAREAVMLEQRIEKAEALIAQREQIEQDHDRYQELQRERDRLDTQRDLHRGIEKQIEQREAALREQRTEHEKRLHTLEVDLRADKQALAASEAVLAEAGSVERSLQAARAAQGRLEKLQALRRRRDDLRERLAELDRVVLTERETLNGRLRSLREALERSLRELPDREVLEKERARWQEAAERLIERREALQRVVDRGQELNEAIRERAGQRAAMEAEEAREAEAYERFAHTKEGPCPTCGTPLTASHREEVDARLREKRSTLRERIEAAGRWIAAREKERLALREQYKALQSEIEACAPAPERLAGVEARLKACAEAKEGIAERRREIAALTARVEEERFAEEAQRQRGIVRRELEGLDFDEEAYERLQGEAAQVERYEDRLRQVEEARGRKGELLRSIEQRDRETEALRHRLDDGSLLGPYLEPIRRLQAQLAQVGFEPKRLDEVRRALQDLAGAGGRLKDLVHAQQNRAEWKDRLEALRAEEGRVREERDGLLSQLADLKETLSSHAGLAARLAQAEADCAGLETERQRCERQLGELKARLDQARDDRRALKEQRKAHAEARAERALYRHLRNAFGKHGIPSLIIEQTLPEIEERTNVLLDQLTDGRMHVRLETLKDKKTGGTKETLDIIITDEQGVPRPYETFSGGEAFRVNFALRIALAQLLAERSGVRIRTLVIDEGFGTQDAQGVENLVEAIQVIQNDFDKILVITHLDQLKEAFPVRIEVAKDPVEGSSFEVLGV